MTPVASWSPADYHRAFNRCRAAWEATSPQLTIDGWADMLDGLDRTPNECRRRPVEPALPPHELPRGAGSQMAGEPNRILLGRSTRGQDASSPAHNTTTPRPAEPGWDLRGSGQKGA